MIEPNTMRHRRTVRSLREATLALVCLVSSTVVAASATSSLSALQERAPKEPAIQEKGSDDKDTPEDGGVTKAEVKAAVKALSEGLAAKEPAARLVALRAAAEVVHDDVVKAITAGLKDKVTTVRDGTLDLLGRIELPSALSALHEHARKQRRTLSDEPEHYALVLKCAARHGDPSTIELLLDKAFDSDHDELERTRVLGLANIRDKRAVEALFDLLTKADRRRVVPRMGELQLAFNVLLGVDVGKNQDRWQAWWNDNKKTYELTPKFPVLPAESLATWERFWGLERTYQRNRRRGDRGQ